MSGAMKDWQTLLPQRLPAPKRLPDVIESDEVMSITLNLLDEVMTWARPDNPGADAIVEKAIAGIVALRGRHPVSYAWARADLLAMFGADGPCSDIEITVDDAPPTPTPRW